MAKLILRLRDPSGYSLPKNFTHRAEAAAALLRASQVPKMSLVVNETLAHARRETGRMSVRMSAEVSLLPLIFLSP